MKLYMTKTYEVYESYGPIEINLEDYPELEGKTEEEIVEHFNEIMYEKTLKGVLKVHYRTSFSLILK